MTCGNASSVFVTSVITARKAGSLAFSVFDWMSTISPISSLVCGKPASMILSACRASPTLVSLVSRYFVPTALPITKDAMTNASQPKTAVFQWLALQRPMRAAKLFECFRGDTVCSFSAGGWW